MQSIFRCGKALGLVLFFGLVCSPFQPAYPASPSSESATSAPDEAIEEKILQYIQYGTPIQTEDAEKAAAAEKARITAPPRPISRIILLNTALAKSTSSSALAGSLTEQIMSPVSRRKDKSNIQQSFSIWITNFPNPLSNRFGARPNPCLNSKLAARS